MAKRRLSVRKIKEVLRLHYEKGFSTRQIAKSLSIGRSTVQDYLDRSERAEIDWSLAAELDEASLEQRLYPSVIQHDKSKFRIIRLQDLHFD